MSGLKCDTVYYFAVKAYGNNAESPFCDELPYSTHRDPKTCTYSLSSKGASYGSSGGAGNVTVSAPECCTWSCSTTASWLNLTSGTTGTGNDAVVYAVTPNTDAEPRTADLTIAGQVFTVTQAGLPVYTITASAGTGGSITPSGSIVVTQGESLSFTIASNYGYRISAVWADEMYLGPVSSYTFSNVTAAHTISVSFGIAKPK